VPESRSRKKAKYTPPPSKSEKNIVDNPRWLVPTMVACFLIGLTWIVLYYTAGNSIPGMSSLGALANVVIGFLFILAGFILAMRWR
jgi:hypothetical protein